MFVSFPNHRFSPKKWKYEDIRLEKKKIDLRINLIHALTFAYSELYDMMCKVKKM